MSHNSKIVSVTTAIPTPAEFADIPPDILHIASKRGRRVHGKVATYCHTLMNPDEIYYIPNLTPDAEPYFESGKLWIDEYVDTILYIEAEFFHPIYQYVGHPDLVAVMKGDVKPAVIDFKTPLQYREREWSAQLAGYKYAINSDTKYTLEHLVDRMLSVRLRANGKMPLVNEVNDGALAFQGFLNALGSYRYFGH